MTTGIAAPKPDLGAKAKKRFWSTFKRNFTRKIASAKIEKSADKSQSQPCCGHSDTIYDAQLQKTIVLLHAAAAPSNLDAAITPRFAASRGKHNKKWQQNIATIRKPFRCDLQHSCSHDNAICIHLLHYNAICIHSLQNTQRRNRLTSKRSKPHPPHTGGTLHRRLQPFYTEKHTVSCSGFLLEPVWHWS